ncbi:MAG: ABC transporter ATP-binding protein [Chloroflexia bacterium]
MSRVGGSLERYLKAHFRGSIYARLIPYMRPYKLSMAVVVLTAIAQSGLGLLDPWPMKILVDNGLGHQQLPGWLKQFFPFLAAGDGGTIIVFAVAIGVALWLAGNLMSLVGEYLKNRVNESIILSFKANLFSHMQHLSFSYHDKTSVGDSMYRLNNDTGFISTLIWGNFRHLLTSGLTLVGIVWIVVGLDWQLALLALAVAPILYLGVWFYGKRFKQKSKQVKKMESASQTIMQEVLSCLKVVKAFGGEAREQRRFETQSWAALRARLRLTLEQNLFSSGLQFVTKLDRSLVLLVGGLHVLAGKLTIGELLVVMSYAGQIHGPLEDIGETLTDMQLSLASAERTLEVLNVEPEVVDKPGAERIERAEGAVAFEDVSFAYDTGHEVLHHISFEVWPGEVAAIVGPTGAGKTTIAGLIARFYDPAVGGITLDGRDLRDLTVDTLRDNIALVIQEPILFTGSIRDNIAYGARPQRAPDGTQGDYSVADADIEEAARMANAHDFILALPNGYDSQVGERGVRLSGGERQRIAIARAFIKDAPVLILDEPTSSVDSRTELMILDALDRLMLGRTTFIIAHRLSTIRRADQIVVIDKGSLIERGTHAQLLAEKGLYAELYRIQSSGLRRRGRNGRRMSETELVETEKELSA